MLQKFLIALLVVFALVGAFLFTKVSTQPALALPCWSKQQPKWFGFKFCVRTISGCAPAGPWRCYWGN